MRGLPLTEEEKRLARLGALRKRYEAAIHGCQTAIAFELAKGETKQIDPKHLRVGINSSLIDSAALAKLLIDRSVFTEEQYYEALAEAAEAELANYERRHAPIKFG